MRRFLFAFVLGMLTGAGGLWYLQTEPRVKTFGEATEQVGKEAEKLKQTVQDTFSELTGEMVREELAHSSVVIESGDHVILFLIDKSRIKQVERLFQVGFGFF